MTRGTATTLNHVIAGRVVTGLGGAGITILVSVIPTGAVFSTKVAALGSNVMAGMVSPGRVAVLRSYFSVAVITGKSAGAPLGGLLADVIGWRW